jgi:membrane associated rhomboid family serine protease
MFGIWVLMQIVGALWIMQGIGDVAVFAHLGGAAVGVLFWW